jgi:hypothetical protein
LAAWIRHASRARTFSNGRESGERERNAWIIYPRDRDSCGKLQVIPDDIFGSNGVIPPVDESASYQLVGKVMAYQGFDGYWV